MMHIYHEYMKINPQKVLKGRINIRTHYEPSTTISMLSSCIQVFMLILLNMLRLDLILACVFTCLLNVRLIPIPCVINMHINMHVGIHVNIIDHANIKHNINMCIYMLAQRSNNANTMCY